MATFTKKRLSGSTDGLAVKVTGTNSAGAVTVHQSYTTVTTAGLFDEIWMYANNTSSSAVKLTLEWGTATAADGNIELTIAAESGLVLVVPGLILQNTKVVKAFAATADVILLTGYVNQIS
jgi:hypothetical protein